MCIHLQITSRHLRRQVNMANKLMCGKFEMTSSEKFDEYMAALKVGFALRKLAATSSPSTEISEADGEWTIKTSTTFKNTEIKFKLGEAFPETTADGRNVTATITKEDNKLIHKQVGQPKDSVIVREFTEGQMKMTLTVDDIVCTRIYKKL